MNVGIGWVGCLWCVVLVWKYSGGCFFYWVWWCIDGCGVDEMWCCWFFVKIGIGKIVIGGVGVCVDGFIGSGGVLWDYIVLLVVDVERVWVG